MGVYRAPLRDMRFWLQLGMESADPPLPAYADLSPELIDAVLEEAARLAEEVLEPVYRLGDRQGARLENGQVHVPPELKAAYAQYAQGGWVGLPASPELGGQGLPQVVAVAVNEIWKSSNLALALCPMLTQGAIETLHRHGDDGLRRRFLPKMVSGAWTGTMNLTEPQAGSDLGALRSTAVPEGDHYRLRGRKIFITWGDHDLTENIIHLVLARTPNAPPGVHGISMFVVPKFLVGEDGAIGARNEITTVSIEEKLGIHASPTCVLSYGDEQGAIAYLVGKENLGLTYMFTMMNSARLAVGVEGLALSERAYQQALAYAMDRVQGSPPASELPGPIFDHPDVRRMLMLMKAGTDAMRALSYAAAIEIDRASVGGISDPAQTRVSVLTPIVKGWCTELAQELVSLGIQIHGGVGYIEETGAAQILRDARITTIYEGTTGIQAHDLVGRKLLRDRGRAVAGLFAEIEALLPELAAGGTDLAATHAALGAGLAAARAAAERLLSGDTEDPSASAAAAVSFLMLMGTLLGGWQLARGGLSAREALAVGGAAKPFLEAKLVTSEFYAEQLMPRVTAYAAAVLAGGRRVMALSAEQLKR